MDHLGHRRALVGSRVVCQDCRVAVGDVADLRRIVHEEAPEQTPGFQMKCPTCGDSIHGPSCPRCNWGVWKNRSEDSTAEFPADVTQELKPGIQAHWEQTIPEPRWSQVPPAGARSQAA